MILTTACLMVIACCAATPPSAANQAPQPGRWRAVLHGQGGEIPFGLELIGTPGGLHAWLRNGREAQQIGRVTLTDDRLVLSFDPYDSRIEARLTDDGSRMEGEWIREREAGKIGRIPFTAQHGESWRFAEERDRSADAPTAPLPPLPRRWRVNFAGDEAPAVALFHTAPATDRAAVAYGTFLTTLGDYRFLAGVWTGEALKLSVFDGAHAFLFTARLQADGKLHGDFWSRDSWHDTFVATPDAAATLDDPFTITRLRHDRAWRDLAFPDVDGNSRTLGRLLNGKANLLVLFGTWCPNCNDESAWLVELDRRHRDRGLRITGLAFEFSDDPVRRSQVVRDYMRFHGIDWPILIAGTSDKQAASAAFPLLERVVAYPTTLFIDRHGEIGAVHTGFSGPATGDAHRRLRDDFEHRIVRMLDDRP